VSAFGAWLLAEIERTGWNQSQFCAEAEISTRTLAGWLYDGKTITLPNADLVAKALHTDLWCVLKAAGLPYEGLRKVPRSAVRRDLWARIERMTDDDVHALLDSL
jgi:transcriptional regulator with XRE-family HTH domain